MNFVFYYNKIFFVVLGKIEGIYDDFKGLLLKYYEIIELEFRNCMSFFF